jgi:hypothetical protein
MLWVNGSIGFVLAVLVSIAWQRRRRPVGDRPVAGKWSRNLGRSGRAVDYPPSPGPGRFAAMTAEDDEAFLRYCRQRAEQQRWELHHPRRDPLPDCVPWLEEDIAEDYGD